MVPMPFLSAESWAALKISSLDLETVSCSHSTGLKVFFRRKKKPFPPCRSNVEGRQIRCFPGYGFHRDLAGDFAGVVTAHPVSHQE